MCDSQVTFINIIVPIVTFVAGFLVSRLTMTKKERKDHQGRLQDRSDELARSRDGAYAEFASALSAYAGKQEEPTLVDFYRIATTGDVYFSSVRTMCDAYLSGNLDKGTFRRSHMPMIKDVANRTLPEFYATLSEIAERSGVEFPAELSREKYASIFEVSEEEEE